MKWRLRGKIKRGKAQDRFLRSLRGFLLPQPPLLRCRGSVPWHGDIALALQSHPQLPRGFLWERSRLFLSLLAGEKRCRCIQRRWQRGSSPRAGVAGQGGGSVPAGGGGDTALSPPGIPGSPRLLRPGRKRGRGLGLARGPRAVSPNHPVRSSRPRRALGGSALAVPHGKTHGKGIGGVFPVPAPPGLSSLGPEAFPAETFLCTNTMRSFSSPRRTMRHCPARSAGNQTGNVSRGTPIPSPAPEEPGWGSPNIPKPFREGFCPGRGRDL